MKTFSFTGHRPDKLGGYGETNRKILKEFAKYKLSELNPDHCISGMALGWDTAVALACVDLSIPWTAAIPFPEQYRVWNHDDQKAWHWLTRLATKVVYVTNSYSVENLQKRNEWMVDHSDYLVALHDGSKGGTYNCIEYAKKMDKPIINWWSSYEAFVCPPELFKMFS